MAGLFLGVERVLALVPTNWSFPSGSIKVSVKRNGSTSLLPMVCMPCLTWLQPYLKWAGLQIPLLVEFILLVELLAFIWLTKSTF